MTPHAEFCSNAIRMGQWRRSDGVLSSQRSDRSVSRIGISHALSTLRIPPSLKMQPSQPSQPWQPPIAGLKSRFRIH